MQLQRLSLPLFLTMTSFLPLTTSLPDFLVASPPPSEGVLTAMDRAGDHQGRRGHYLSYVRQPQTHGSPTPSRAFRNIEDGNSEAEGLQGDLGDSGMPGGILDIPSEGVIAGETPTHSTGTVPAHSRAEATPSDQAEKGDEEGEEGEEERLTQQLQTLLAAIQQQVQEVGKRQQAWLRLQQLLHASRKKSGRPTSHFLRIGRSVGGSVTGGGLSLAGLSSPLYTGPYSDSLAAGLATGLGIQEDNVPAGLVDTDGERGFHQDEAADITKRFYVMPRKFRRFLRFGRGYQPRNHFVRFGRSYMPRNQFVRFGRARQPLEPTSTFSRQDKDVSPRTELWTDEDGDSFSDNTAQPTSGKRSGDRPDPRYVFSIPARRSYVRIGRLPSSVFRQRMRQAQQVGPDTTLGGRRSSGYRLTKSGIMRAGKRTL